MLLGQCQKQAQGKLKHLNIFSCDFLQFKILKPHPMYIILYYMSSEILEVFFQNKAENTETNFLISFKYFKT